LRHNTGTDEDKIKVNTFMCSQPQEYREWYQRILLKDLKCGITEKTINKIWKDLIPTFSVQLAEPFERFFDNVACEVKIDGCRNLVIKQNGIVRMFTRNGKPIEGFNSVAKDIQNLPIDNIVFDGEIIGKDYTDTMNQLFAKGQNKQATYMIFDMLTPEEFYKGESDNDYWTRKQGLINLRKSIDSKRFNNLHFVEPIAILDNPTIEQFNKIMNNVVANGFEGIMVKPLDSKYKAKRSYDWQKLKPFESDEFKIIGFEPGDGKLKNTLGKVIINVNGVSVGVGSGFSEAQRDDIWNNQQQYLNKWIEVQYQEKIEKTGSLRFPTVKNIRLDKE
jgi:DNA ligase-1